MQLLPSPSLTSGTCLGRLDQQTEVGDVGEAHRARQPGGEFVRTADRLAVGVSRLTRPDSFHAGSCNSEREDWVRFRLFDVGVAFAFEDSAQLARVCFWKPCWVSVPWPQRPSDLSNNRADHFSPRLLSFYNRLSDPDTRFSHHALLFRKYKSFLLLWAAGRSDYIFFL